MFDVNSAVLTKRGLKGIHVRRTLSAIMFVVFLGACDSFPGGTSIGVTQIGSDQDVKAEYVPCAGGTVTSVKLLAVTGKVVGDEDDRVLWEIDAQTPVSLTGVEVGANPPNGFQQVRALSGALPQGVDLAVQMVVSPGSSVSVEFRLSDLVPNRIYSEGQTMTQGEFVTRAKKRCS